MLKQALISCGVAMVIATPASAASKFTCEQIKQKDVRVACIAERDEKIRPRGSPLKSPEEEIADVERKEAEAKKQELARFAVRAEAEVRAKLKDPDSAQFRNVYVADSLLLSLCGEVNAKNAYGGYVGFKRFRMSTIAGRVDSTADIWIEPSTRARDEFEQLRVQTELEQFNRDCASAQKKSYVEASVSSSAR
jgi:uncharacterized protein (DUF3084 family)